MPDQEVQTFDREKIDLIERRVLASRLRAQNLSFRAIAEKLGVSVAQAHSDVSAAREYWKERAAEHFEAHIASILEDIETAKAEAFEAWHASKGTKITTTETRSSKGKRSTVKTTSDAGDPRFLIVIERLNAQKLAAVTGLKGDSARGRTLADFLAVGREAVNVEFQERRITAKVTRQT